MSDNILEILQSAYYENTHSELEDLLGRIQHSDVDAPNSHFTRIIGEHLEQYGVLGMKWGVRNDRSGKSRSRASDDSASKSKKAKKAAESKSTSSRQNERLSDDELRKLVDRIQLEQRYSALTASQKASPSRAQTILKDVAYDVAKGATTEVGKLILAQVLKVQYNKVAGQDFKVPTKEIKKAMGG